MEEDLKILEEFIKYNKYFREEDGKLTITIDESLKSKLDGALKNLLKCYKELEEEWDKDTHTLQNALDLANADKINNYIPVSLVEEKIEELQKELEEKYSAEKISVFSGNTYMEKFKLLGKVQVLQELLEKRK